MRSRLPLALWLMAAACASPGSGEPGATGTSGGDASGDGQSSTTQSTYPGGVTTAPCPDGDCGSSSATGGPGGYTPDEQRCQDDFDDDNDGRVDCLDDDCWSDAVCSDRFLRVATFNIREVGAPGSEQYDALVAVITRIDADLLCLQEVGDEETAALEQLAIDTGYPSGSVASAGRPTAGMIRNACLMRFAPADIDDVDSDALSSDPAASDMARAVLRTRVRIGGIDRWVTLLNAHLKAGTDESDRFRRQVEFIRLRQAVELEREMFPDNTVIVLGDLNQTPGGGSGQSWAEVPSGMPFSYQLGSDIALPVVFDPFAELDALGLSRVEATVEDAPYTDTYLPGLIRLDYIYYDPADAVPVVEEAYEACDDDGVDAPPLGDRLPKAGEPLPCGTGADASDHRPVVVDFYFE